MGDQPVPRNAVLHGRHHTIKPTRNAHRTRRHQRRNDKTPRPSQEHRHHHRRPRHRSLTQEHRKARRQNSQEERSSRGHGLHSLLQGPRRKHRRTLAKRPPHVDTNHRLSAPLFFRASSPSQNQQSKQLLTLRPL